MELHKGANCHQSSASSFSSIFSIVIFVIIIIIYIAIIIPSSTLFKSHRDAKSYLNSTDATMVPQKLASTLLLWNSHEADLFGRMSQGSQNPGNVTYYTCVLDLGINLNERGISAHRYCSFTLEEMMEEILCHRWEYFWKIYCTITE